MSSKNKSSEFSKMFFKRYDELLNKVTSSLTVAATEPDMTDDQRKEVVRSNIKTIILMSNIYWKEEDVFNKTGKFPEDLQ